MAGALAAPGLEHVQLLVLDGELEVLDIAVVLLQVLGDLVELVVGLGQRLLQLRDRLGGADSGDDVLALRVDQELSVELVLAGARVAREADAGARPLARVAEHHGLDVDGRAHLVRDLVHLPVRDRAGVLPGAEHGVAGQAKLLPHVLGELAVRAPFEVGLELAGEVLQVLGRELRVAVDALLLLALVQERLELALGDVEDDVGEHHEEAAVAVPREARVARLGREALDRRVVEAEIEDRVHHAGHRYLRARSNGDEQRVLRVAELLAGGLLQLSEELLLILVDALGRLLAVFVVVHADERGDGEARGDRDPRLAHLGEARALAAENVLHVAGAVRLAVPEEVDGTCHFPQPQVRARGA